ncbi:MAG: TlyA family RNA methyltransferase [Chloroflexi bacterium]|nr:TlyA family RNA methyltransferase [Chloroflexota bacterium]
MPASSKIRLDQLVVQLGLAPDIREAGALVMAGKVVVVGERASPTPGMQVQSDVEITVAPEKQFVSRGGEKLAYALDSFGIDVEGAVCLDVGASTGGFTDCLLQNGAKRVYAVDTGRGQLHQRLVHDQRVISMERTNIAEGVELPESIDFVVADVSFTSLKTVLPSAFEHFARSGGSTDSGRAVVLLKPQFEAKRTEVPRGGVVVDPIVHAAVIGRFVRWAGESGVRIRNLKSSGILGDKGNREFLLHLQYSPPVG